MKVLDPIDLRPLPHERLYELTHNVRFIIDDEKFTIPKGFKTDGASIPKPAQLTTGTPFAPEYIGAAVPHDYLYQTGLVSRLVADSAFRIALVTDGVPGYTATKMFLAVRCFGWIPWRRYRKNGGRNGNLGI